MAVTGALMTCSPALTTHPPVPCPPSIAPTAPTPPTPHPQAREACEDNHNTQITPVHLFLALTDEGTSDILPRVLTKLGADAGRLKGALKAAAGRLPKQDPPPDSVGANSDLVKVLRAADALRKKGDDSHIAVDHMISAGLTDPAVSKALTEAGVNAGALVEGLKDVRGGRKVTSESAEAQYDALAKYAEDLVARAEVRTRRSGARLR